MLAAVVLYLQRKNFLPIASKRMENVYVAIYTFFIIGISVYALARMPQIDLGDYKAGTNLADYEGGTEQVYNTILIYAKDGKEQEFTLDNLPDTTWQFVDSKTTLVTEDTTPGHVDFVLKDAAGNYVAQKVLDEKKPLFMASFYNLKSVSEKRIGKLIRLNDTLSANGAVLYILSGNSVENTEAALGTITIPVLYSDYKTVLSFNRSNGGLTYLSDGDVVEKWASGNYPFPSLRRILARDPEVLMANGVIGDQLFAEICLALIFFMIVIVRFVSKFMYQKYLSKLEDLENIH